MLTMSLLGPLDGRVNGKSVVPSARKPRQVLALLAIHAGQIVPLPTLIEELWGGQEPRSAIPTIQTYILGLRRRINSAIPDDAAGAAKNILGTRPRGYILDISPDHVDVPRYHYLAAAGQAALADGAYESASRVLGSALQCWRGPALIDVQPGPQLGIELMRLEQSWLSVLDARIEADLHLGRHHRLLGELAELTARYPMHEKLCSHYMTALTASGQKWRALEVFRTLRKTLAGELGVEPSFQVQRLQRAILSFDGSAVESPAWQSTASG